MACAISYFDSSSYFPILNLNYEKGVFMEHSISIIEDFDGRKIVLIHDIRFKGKRKINWKEVEGYLKEKHKKDAKNGWYRYTSNFALTVYDENEMVQRYNVFRIEMLVRHAKGGKMYLYDMVNIKKRTEQTV